MRVPCSKVSIDFVRPEWDNSEMVPVADLPAIGQPICTECGDLSIEMDMGMADISEANSC